MYSTKLIEVNEVSSTNDYLKKLAYENDLQEGTVVLAKFQNKGRGIGSNYWESEIGKNITFSLLLCPDFLPGHQIFLISKIISLGIYDYLKTITGNISIKWPNDIYYSNKKLAGILIENQFVGSKINYSIIGVGLNVNQEVFYSNAPNPISLANILGKQIDLDQTLNGILDSIQNWYRLLSIGDTDKINEAYFSHLLRNKGMHQYSENNKTFMARIKSVENDGQLILETEQNEEKKFYFKEVEYLF